MSKTKIEWCDVSWNPMTGCSKISPGCDNCYAERMSKRNAGRFGYPKDDPFRPGVFHEDRLEQPLHWKKPRRIFVGSMRDMFHEDVEERHLEKIREIMCWTLQHTYIILTKRPGRMGEFFSKHKVLPNLWLGVSVENQKTAEERIPILLQIPAAKRFVSVEPMLGPVYLQKFLKVFSRCDRFCNHPCAIYHGRQTRLDWVICGAETGPGARPMDPDWARRVRDDCKAANVPFFMKKISGGGELPEDLKIREWPV